MYNQILQMYNLIKSKDTSLSSLDRSIYEKKIRVPDCEKGEYIDHFIKLLDKEIRPILFIREKEFKETAIFYLSHIFFMIDRHSFAINKALLLAENS